jgi:hypothetical protein
MKKINFERLFGTLKSIPELKDLPPEERIKIWLACTPHSLKSPTLWLSYFFMLVPIVIWFAYWVAPTDSWFRVNPKITILFVALFFPMMFIVSRIKILVVRPHLKRYVDLHFPGLLTADGDQLISTPKLSGRYKTFETFTQHLKQIEIDSLEAYATGDYEFIVPQHLADKITPEGKLKPFYGDTTIIFTTEEQYKPLFEIKEKLEEGFGDILADSLDNDQLHMTMHDLSNGMDEDGLRSRLKHNRVKTELVLNELDNFFETNPKLRYVKMKMNLVYPSGNIAVLAAMHPVSILDFNVLMNVYNMFNSVIELDYIFRPHITLGYFKPLNLDKDVLKKLAEFMMEQSRTDITVTVDLKKIVYKRFYDMNHYV